MQGMRLEFRKDAATKSPHAGVSLHGASCLGWLRSRLVVVTTPRMMAAAATSTVTVASATEGMSTTTE